MTHARQAPLTPLRHAYLARLLIKACGGLEEAADSTGCRVGKSQLANFQDPERVLDPERCQFMPADVIGDLEAYCGKRYYSEALYEARPAKAEARSLVEESVAALQDMANVVQSVTTAAADGVVSPGERKVIEQLLVTLSQRLAKISAANSGGCP